MVTASDFMRWLTWMCMKVCASFCAPLPWLAQASPAKSKTQCRAMCRWPRWRNTPGISCHCFRGEAIVTFLSCTYSMGWGVNTQTNLVRTLAIAIPEPDEGSGALRYSLKQVWCLCDKSCF